LATLAVLVITIALYHCTSLGVCQKNFEIFLRVSALAPLRAPRIPVTA